MARGLSADDKRSKLLEIFHETKDFYQLKELEKLGPKMKGIVSQSVKEVLQDLVDDDRVQTDKIGSGNFYWSFPSQTGATVAARLEDVKKDIQKLEERRKDILQQMEEARHKRQPSDERTKALTQLHQLRNEKEKLAREKADLMECDAALFEQKKRGAILAKEAAERWTESALAVVQYLQSQGQEANIIRHYFGMPEGWEELE